MEIELPAAQSDVELSSSLLKRCFAWQRISEALCEAAQHLELDLLGIERASMRPKDPALLLGGATGSTDPGLAGRAAAWFSDVRWSLKTMIDDRWGHGSEIRLRIGLLPTIQQETTRWAALSRAPWHVAGGSSHVPDHGERTVLLSKDRL